MKRFYVDVLGFAVDGSRIRTTSISRRAATILRSIEPRAGRAAPPASQALDHLGLIVTTADDVDRWAAFLDSRGVTVVARPKTHRDGARSCYVKDPDGNTVQIIHHPPISAKYRRA